MSQMQTLLTHRLANGLQIVGCPMPDAESVAVAYFIRTGARDEDDPSLSGISHFLEHILFKGTKTLNRPQLDQAFNRVGAQRNGFTSIEHTLYYVQILPEYLFEAFGLLSAMMYPRFIEEEFQAEKDVILNEIARLEDHPRSAAYFHLLRTYFGKHTLGNHVLGSPESIQQMRLDQIHKYWQERYVASNSILTIAGRFHWDTFLRATEDQGSIWQSGQGGRIALPYEPVQPNHLALVRPRQKQQILLFAMPMLAKGDPDSEAAFLGTSILGRPQGSRFYWSIVHKGLAVQASAHLWPLEGTGLLFFQTNGHPDKAREIVTVLKQEFHRFLEDGVTNDELERAKAMWVSDLVRSTDLPYPQMWTLALDWVAERRLVLLKERIRRIQQITINDILQVFHRFPLREKQIVATYGPLSEEAFSW